MSSQYCACTATFCLSTQGCSHPISSGLVDMIVIGVIQLCRCVALELGGSGGMLPHKNLNFRPSEMAYVAFWGVLLLE